MAPSQQHAVKSLNTASVGRRRFVFKTFSQRVEEIDINVFRSLEPVKAQPSSGSSFFLETLVKWRELNTAEHFISFFMEMLPLVQTLPQVLHNAENIFSELLARLNMDARLSLEPILSLIAALARDILELFKDFLPQLVVALVDLLKNGADRDPEILEQVLTSWSYIVMYLQKYLVRDVSDVLEKTLLLRFYSKDYIQEFVAESIAFLLRNAPIDQLYKGIEKSLLEVAVSESTVNARRNGVVAMLFHTMRGSSTRLHSRAEKVFYYLVDKSSFIITEGPQDIADVITGVIDRLCTEINPKELKLVYNCFFRSMSNSMKKDCSVHLKHLLDLITFTISKGSVTFDRKIMLEFISMLTKSYMKPPDGANSEDVASDVISSILQLMLSLLKVLVISDDLSKILLIYRPAFELGNAHVLTFIRGLIDKDSDIVNHFQSHILSAMDDMIEDSPEEVLFLIFKFFEERSSEHVTSVPSGIQNKVHRICKYAEKTILHWTEVLSDGATHHDKVSEVSVLWGVLSCYYQFQVVQDDFSLIKNFISTLDQLLLIEADEYLTIPKSTWQNLLGVALTAYGKMLQNSKLDSLESVYFILLAKKHKSSPHVLSAVADFLDYVLGGEGYSDKSTVQELCHNVLDSIAVFADNLRLPNKTIRISTLRILSHYGPLVNQLSERPLKRLRIEESGSDFQDNNVIDILLSIERTPLSISTSHKFNLLISKLQRALSSGKISASYIPLLLTGIIGTLHNRFGHMWDPSLECLATLVGSYKDLVWSRFAQYLEDLQSRSLSSSKDAHQVNSGNPRSIGLIGCFNSFLASENDSTPCATVVTLLLKSLYKIPHVAESRSKELVPLFLKFMGYDNGIVVSVETYNKDCCKGMDWKDILKEWLSLLCLMRNARSFCQSHTLKKVLEERLLPNIDPDIQSKVLDCLLNWKDDYLMPYSHHLKKLIVSKNLREELTSWTISRESGNIQEEHRCHLIPVVIKILIPKVQNLKTLGSRKHTGLSYRRAVLCFLSLLDIEELQFFFSLLLKPLIPNFPETGVLDFGNVGALEDVRDQMQMSSLVNISMIGSVSDISWKKTNGFLHVVEDILGTFDELRLKPYLSLILMIIVHISERCMLDLASSKKDNVSIDIFGDINAASPATNEASQLVLNSTVVGDAKVQSGVANFADLKEDYSSANRIKDIRSLCLKIISTSLNKYESDYFGSDFWKVFFRSIKPLINSFKQEGSSSAKPSSLFSCFLAMSRSFKLAKLLEREPDLVPNIFSMLTVRTATGAVLSSVLDFVENLLNLDNDSSNEEGNSLKLVSPHLEVLIHSFHVLLQSRKEHHGRKSKVWLEKELRILKLLAKYINNCTVGGQFLDILLQLFKRMDANSDECLEGLHVVKVILPLIKSPETSTRIVYAIHPLLISAGMEPRTCICDILDGLKSDDPSLDILATYLRALNAVSSTQIGEPDYDARVTAYQEVKEELFLKLREEHALVILSQCIHDMLSGELIFRQSASSALFSFIKFAGSVLNGYKENSSPISSDYSAQNEMKSLTVKLNDNEVPTWTISSIQLIVKKSIMHHMGEAMNKYSSIQEWASVLRELVCNLEEIPYLNSLRSLLSEDPEVDFFKNIVHLQIHRRRRALSRFRDVIGLGNLAEDVSVKIFLPMFYNMMFDVKDGKGEDLRNACLETLASITRHMSWQSYRTFLMKCFHEMVIKPERQKILLRLICAVIEAFHFFCINSSEVQEGDADMGTSDYKLRDLTNDLPTNVPYEIQVYLQKSVVPKIQKLLKSDSDKVNVTINLALLKLLKLMPSDTMDSHLSSIIHRICGFLKHRLESVRGEARSALAACLKELGLEYLHVVVKVLQAILKRGYELHVFGYTLNFILSNCLVPSAVGKLDHCLGELLSVVENDILGNVAEEKEVDKIASKMKETRKNKSFETLTLISQYITFQAHAKELLTCINSHLQKHLTPKIKAKLEMMLHHIALGIECNPSASSSEQLFVFVHCLMKDTVTADGSHGKETTIAGSGEKSANSHLISVFALELLHTRLKKELDKRDEQLLSMLDPFVELLGYYLSSKYEQVLSATFRCLILLVKLPLPSLEAQANKIKSSLFEIAQKSGNANASLVQSCLKLLAFLLRSNVITLSDDQLRMLIQFPLFVDIQTKPSPVALSLLKSIVARKLVVFELYDIVMRVSELMVTSHSEPIRKKCSQILLQFLLDYRPSTKRLEQYMHFLLNNLSYEYSSGREAVLEMLRVILVKFPESFVESYAQTIFVQLVVALANETDSKIKDMISAVIKSLIEKISHHQLGTILDFSLQWYKSDKQHLWSASAQVLGLLVEVFKDGFQNCITDVLKVATGILQAFSEVKFSNNLELPFWREAYHTLIMVKNVLHQFPGLYFDRKQEGIWMLVCRLLLHQHVLVRNTSTQLVASYFSAMKSQDSKLYDGRPFLCRPGRLFLIAVLLFNQLKSQLIDDAESNLLTQNLAFIVCHLHSFAEQAGSLNSYWSSIDDSERDSCLEGFNLLGSRKAKNAFLLCTDIQSQSSEGKDQMDQNDAASGLHSLLIVPIIRRIGKIALEMQDIQMKIVLNCFKIISVETGIRGHNYYAIHMLLPLYKVCEGFAGNVVIDEIKQLAEEVRDRIRELIGMETFIKLYHSIGKSMKEKRDKRKHEQKLIAATDPQRHAKRKLRIAAKHKDNKRRKMVGMKMGRWRR